MKTALTALLMLFACRLSAQSYTFPNIGQPQARQISTLIDTLFAGMGRGQIATELISVKGKELTREMLEYYKYRLPKGINHHIINCYALDSAQYRVVIAGSKADTLQQIYTFDVQLSGDHPKVDLPLYHDTRNWQFRVVGTIRYRYDHDFNPTAAKAFDAANKRIAQKLGLPTERFDFYLADNYQQIMQWLGLTYDKLTVGQNGDGYNAAQTIFAIRHNEDFSHDLVHYYVYKIRKSPRNPFAEEGVAYYWGNAYYPDTQGKMINLDRLKKDLRAYLAAHPSADWLALFRQNQRGAFGPVKEISPRSTISAIIAEAIEQKRGTDGIIKLLNCGTGEASYFAATDSLLNIITINFNKRVAELLGK
jgi:hypothetical protein